MKRRITKTHKDSAGNITIVCSSEAWAPRLTSDVITDIDLRGLVYVVNEAGYESTVQTVLGVNGTKFLRTTADRTSKNNLDNLPSC